MTKDTRMFSSKTYPNIVIMRDRGIFQYMFYPDGHLEVWAVKESSGENWVYVDLPGWWAVYGTNDRDLTIMGLEP